MYKANKDEEYVDFNCYNPTDKCFYDLVYNHKTNTVFEVNTRNTKLNYKRRSPKDKVKK